MGLQCTKVAQSSKQVHDIRRIDDMESQLRAIKDVAIFNIIIKDLRLLNFSHTFHLIKIEITGEVTIEISSNHFLKQDRIWIAQNEFTARIKAPIYEIANKMVSISILDKFGKALDQLKMKLYHLSTGPVKHDHLLKGLKSRLLFDFEIDQYLDVEVSLRECKIAWKNSSFKGDESYFLNLIFSNCNHHMQATKMYEKHQKIKGFSLDRISIRNSQLNDSIIRLKMVTARYEQDHIQYYIPYSKVVQQSSYKLVTGEGGVFESRQLTLNQHIIIKGEKVGEISFTIALTKSKLYVEQMDCVILSQNGIVMTTPSDFEQKEKELDEITMLNYLKKLRSGKNFGISDFEFYKMMEELCVCLQEGKEFDMTDDIFKTQEILLDFLLELGECIQEDSLVRNSFIWKILHLILHKNVMNLRYFGSIDNVQSKKKYALKFYDFLIGMLIRIIKYITNGINFKELEYIQQFVAYAFFRFSWCQTQIIQSLSRESDPNISQEKIAEIGASCRCRSPSKSYFYDWEANVLTLIRKDEVFLKMLSRLERVQMENPRWAALLFDREYEQLFYGLFSQLWDEAEVFLRNGSRIMWQYFPSYGELLSIFFGEMNGSGIIDFSAEMTRCNMKLIKNEKLLNTFMMLIFPKTCLYETYSVLKCLDLINCYFLVILKSNKNMPHDFHYNYFYTGIRCILQSNHSFLLQQMLTILYKYYNIFSKEFKETLNHYITYKVFNQLFMHWSHQVRSIFHLLLIFKLSKYEIGENPQSMMKNGKISSHHEERENCEAILQNISILREMKMEQKKEKKSQQLSYFQKMKIKLAKKNKLKPLNSCQILKVNSCQDFDNPINVRRNTGDFIVSPLLIRRKWSVAVSFEEERPTPTEQEMTYLGISLREFDLAKTEKNPDGIVETRSKMLQINIDQ